MEKIVNELLKEELYYEKLENGLDVYFMPKRGFTKKYAVLATNYGSNDLEFIVILPVTANNNLCPHFLSIHQYIIAAINTTATCSVHIVNVVNIAVKISLLML